MRLLTPGPVALADPIRLSLSQEMIYHRGPEIKALIGNIVPRLKKDFNADHVFLVTGSGTAGIEMAFACLTKPNDKSLVIANGTFGDKLASCSKVYCSTQVEKQPLGKGWSLERAKDAIDRSGAQIFAMVYNETSTGVLNDARAICSYAKSKGMVTILDAVSGWGAAPLDIKEFRVDFAATGSQKAMGAAPGMGIVAFTEEAMKRAESITARSFYLDMKKYKKDMENSQTPYTPAVSAIFSIKAALDYIDSRGGWEAHRARHGAAAEKSRKFVESMGYKVFAEPGFYSPTITGFILENADEIRKQLREKYQLVTARDFGELQGKFFRICHIGNFEDKDLEYAFDAIRKVLGK
ncbi:TPA: alanine--glyoxylate aminotransferase family protein [Candidatus Micrarchaeota archaeon]|nr:alanine--glyoxylate aminotransferase family protein [Candidatus Micrarchaeota archaeon]HIH30949.1 alanine--glyoxylate aminotransferase family protein [Candidatus Micrarchaeota archaeon]